MSDTPIPSGTNAILVTGRPISNYAACGEAVPADRAIHNCLGCKQPVSISLQADEILRTKGREPHIVIAGAMCPVCIRRATEVCGNKATITPTALGEEKMKTNPRSSAFYEELKKNTKGHRKYRLVAALGAPLDRKEGKT